MSDAIGAMLASASVAQSLFGDSGGGIASRLQSAIGVELARARVDADFAAAAVGSAAFAGSVERRAAASRLWPSLASESAGAARDSRVRLSERDRDDDRNARDGDGRDSVDDDESEIATAAIPRWQLEAIVRALQAARDAASAAGCSGSLTALVLPGALAASGRVASACTVFVLCTSFDGDLGATRRIWGFGYADTVLAATLDGRRVDVDQPGDPSRNWIVEQQNGFADGEHRSVVVAHGNERWIGLLLTDDRFNAIPDRWEFESTAGPLAC